MADLYQATLPGSAYSAIPGFYLLWGSGTGFGALPASWFPEGYSASQRTLSEVRVTQSGGVEVSIGSGAPGQNLLESVRPDLALRLTTPHAALTVTGIGGTGASADTADPYIWTPDNVADAIAFYNAIVNRRNVACDITIQFANNDLDVGITLERPWYQNVARARPLDVGITLDRPRYQNVARARPLEVGVELARPFDSQNRPRPLQVGVELVRPHHREVPVPRPLEVGITLERAGAIDFARLRPLEVGITLERAGAIDFARPRPLDVGITLRRPDALRRFAPLPLDVGITLDRPRHREIPVPLPLEVAVALATPYRPYTRTAPRDAGAKWRRAMAALAPDVVVVEAMEISHPMADDLIRIVNDTEGHVIDDEDFAPIRFGARLGSDVEGEAPRAQIEIGNVGRELTEWVERLDGGAGGTVRLLEVSLYQVPIIEWEVRLRVESIRIGTPHVQLLLGMPRLGETPAVAARHDDRRSPGLS